MGNRVTIQCSEPLQINETAASDFTVENHLSIVKTISSVIVSGSRIVLYLSDDITSTETITVDYTPPSDGIADLAGNYMGSFTNRSVNNRAQDLPSDVTPPTFRSAATNTDGDEIDITMSETVMEAGGDTAARFNVSANGTVLTISSVIVSGNVVTLNLSSDITNGQTVYVSYVPTTSMTEARITDSANLQLVRFTNRGVTNNVPEPEPEVTPQKIRCDICRAPAGALQISGGNNNNIGNAATSTVSFNNNFGNSIGSCGVVLNTGTAGGVYFVIRSGNRKRWYSVLLFTKSLTGGNPPGGVATGKRYTDLTNRAPKRKLYSYNNNDGRFNASELPPAYWAKGTWGQVWQRNYKSALFVIADNNRNWRWEQLVTVGPGESSGGNAVSAVLPTVANFNDADIRTYSGLDAAFGEDDGCYGFVDLASNRTELVVKFDGKWYRNRF